MSVVVTWMGAAFPGIQRRARDVEDKREVGGAEAGQVPDGLQGSDEVRWRVALEQFAAEDGIHRLASGWVIPSLP